MGSILTRFVRSALLLVGSVVSGFSSFIAGGGTAIHGTFINVEALSTLKALAASAGPRVSYVLVIKDSNS